MKCLANGLRVQVDSRGMVSGGSGSGNIGVGTIGGSIQGGSGNGGGKKGGSGNGSGKKGGSGVVKIIASPFPQILQFKPERHRITSKWSEALVLAMGSEFKKANEIIPGSLEKGTSNTIILF